ncbi:MAG: hypothetical protein JWL84_1040 [Rhodospirillales bacterium]|jgi:ApbE superfamily uncharacterized protein (UPF0280 family)|nr:hypothetical protein [Rhodospirillales bacterium]
MIKHNLDRRRLFRAMTAAVGGFCFSLMHARAAAALSLQQASPDLAQALALANRCGGNDQAHEAIALQLEAALDKEAAPRGTTITQTAACPFCGCPVTVSRVVP